jgi:hypothetical protein
MLGNNFVHEACKKQKVVTKNSTEAELVVLSDYKLEGELVEELIIDLGTLMDDIFVTNVDLVYQDNQNTIAMVKSIGGKPRSKHIKVRQEYVKERLSNCVDSIHNDNYHINSMLKRIASTMFIQNTPWQKLVLICRGGGNPEGNLPEPSEISIEAHYSSDLFGNF